MTFWKFLSFIIFFLGSTWSYFFKIDSMRFFLWFMRVMRFSLGLMRFMIFFSRFMGFMRCFIGFMRFIGFSMRCMGSSMGFMRFLWDYAGGLWDLSDYFWDLWDLWDFSCGLYDLRVLLRDFSKTVRDLLQWFAPRNYHAYKIIQIFFSLTPVFCPCIYISYVWRRDQGILFLSSSTYACIYRPMYVWVVDRKDVLKSVVPKIFETFENKNQKGDFSICCSIILLYNGPRSNDCVWGCVHMKDVQRTCPKNIEVGLKKIVFLNWWSQFERIAFQSSFI